MFMEKKVLFNGRRCHRKTLQDAIYLDLRVRMKLSGKIQVVLIVRNEKGEFKCTDIVVQKDEMILLKELGNWIYVVRHLE